MKHLSSADLWRAFTGLLLGGIISYVLVLLFGESKTYESNVPAILNMIGFVFFLPIFGLVSVVSSVISTLLSHIPFLNQDELEFWIGAPIILSGILFYPLLSGVMFYLGGKPQSKFVLVLEAVIVISVVELGIMGWLTAT